MKMQSCYAFTFFHNLIDFAVHLSLRHPSIRSLPAARIQQQVDFLRSAQVIAVLRHRSTKQNSNSVRSFLPVASCQCTVCRLFRSNTFNQVIDRTSASHENLQCECCSLLLCKVAQLDVKVTQSYCAVLLQHVQCMMLGATSAVLISLRSC